MWYLFMVKNKIKNSPSYRYTKRVEEKPLPFLLDMIEYKEVKKPSLYRSGSVHHSPPFPHKVSTRGVGVTYTVCRP